MKIKKKYQIFLGFIIFFIILIASQIKIPFIIQINGRIYPSEEWLLTQNQNDFITAAYINHLENGENQKKYFSFERGDIININFKPTLNLGSYIKVGDTLATIQSNELLLRKTKLKGDINLARENLKVIETGENKPVITEAQQRYDQAIAKFNNQTNIFNRNAKLYDDDLISDEEFEIQKSLFKISETDVNIAKAQLEAVSIGLKPEIIKQQLQLIENLSEQYQIVLDRIKSSILLSPLNGLVTFTSSNDTLLWVRGNEHHIAVFLIPIKYQNKLQIGQIIKMYGAWSSKSRGSVLFINRDITELGGKSVNFIIVKMDDENTDFINGQKLQAKLILGKNSLANIFLDFLK
ncbi:MAG: hypothetical protein MUP82_07815 [Candidatus Marinimicrobia bacterium]|nr:hypothetical protein [Candidatus Neomarinimicrobiota bacterium]